MHAAAILRIAGLLLALASERAHAHDRKAERPELLPVDFCLCKFASAASGHTACGNSPPVLAEAGEVAAIPLPVRQSGPDPPLAEKSNSAPAFTLDRQKRGGHTARAELREGRLSVRIDSTAGSEIYRPGQHMFTGALTARDSWRRQVDIAIAPANFEAIGLKLNTTAYSERRPSLGGRGTRFGVGDFTRWRESNSWDAGISLELPGSGIRYEGGFGWAQFAYTDAALHQQESDPLRSPPRWRSGTSFWHRIEADIWKGENGEASAFAFIGRMGEQYRSYRRRNASPLAFEGRTFEAGGRLKHGSRSFSFRHQSVDGPYIAFRETEGQLHSGALDLKLTAGNWMVRDPDFPDWSARDRFWNARAKLSLQKLFGGNFGMGLLPDRFTVKLGRKVGAESLFATRSTWRRETLGVGATWSGKGAETDVSISRTVTVRPAPGLAGYSRRREVSLDFTHVRYGEWWDVTIYGALNQEAATHSSSHFMAGGASVSISGDRLPKISFGVDVNGLALRSDGYRLRDRGVNVRVSLDLSRYLPQAGKGRAAWLVIKASGDWSRSHDDFNPNEDSLRPAAMLVFGRRF